MNVVVQSANAVLDRLIAECDGDSADLIIRVRRRNGAGQLFMLTTVGPPPSELTITQWIEHLFGGGHIYNLAFRIRGLAGNKAIKSVELDLRESDVDPKKPPRGGWKNVGLSQEELDALDLDDDDDDDDNDDDDDDQSDGGYSSDPLVRELLTEAREERRMLEARLRRADVEREKDRRAEARRSHELMLALIGKPAPAATTDDDPLTALIKKRVLKDSTDRLLGRSTGGGVDDEDLGLFDKDSKTFLDPALRAFGNRAAELFADDDADDDADENEENEELVKKAAEARANRQRRAAAARELHKRKAKKAKAKPKRNGRTNGRTNRRTSKRSRAAPSKETKPQAD